MAQGKEEGVKGDEKSSTCTIQLKYECFVFLLARVTPTHQQLITSLSGGDNASKQLDRQVRKERGKGLGMEGGRQRARDRGKQKGGDNEGGMWEWK